jgi:hypothetical protein
MSLLTLGGKCSAKRRFARDCARLLSRSQEETSRIWKINGAGNNLNAISESKFSAHNPTHNAMFCVT